MGSSLTRRHNNEHSNHLANQHNWDYMTSDLTLYNTTEKSYDPCDTTLTFVDGKDDMDFLCMDYTSLRARMSCGHTVTPMSLTDWCQRQLDKGDTTFKCGQTDCNAEWPYEEVCKMALLTPEEKKYFEKKLFSNNAKDKLDVKKCPGCKCCVVRHNPNNLCVKCPKCTVKNKSLYTFCWQCLREWRGPAPAPDRCENDDCGNEQLQVLKNCPVIKFRDVRRVRGCPSIRACPTCGKLLGHNKQGCKNIKCTRCKMQFCFVCLKKTEECLVTSSHFKRCSSGVAPRQTVIPVWSTGE